MSHEYREVQREMAQLRREIAELRARKPGPLEARGGGSGGGGSLPVGEKQFQVAQMVSDNQVGYDYVRAHPIDD